MFISNEYFSKIHNCDAIIVPKKISNNALKSSIQYSYFSKCPQMSFYSWVDGIMIQHCIRFAYLLSLLYSLSAFFLVNYLLTH